MALVAAAVVIAHHGASSQAPAVSAPAPVGQWRSLDDLAVIRGSTTAVALHGGRVLVVGGGVGSIPLAGSEVFDPATNAWTIGGNLNDARRGNATVVVGDGRALTVGGIAGSRVLSSAELFDPATDRWVLAAPMHEARFNQTLTLLADGRVLAAGGIAAAGLSLSSAEVYDPRADAWTTVAGGMHASRTDAAAQRLSDGRVIIVGGAEIAGGVRTPLSSVELFDPAGGVFTRAASMSEPRDDLTVTLLRGGRVLAAGGYSASTTVASAEIFDPATGSWGTTGAMAQSRRLHSASLLADGRVLVAGGEQVLGGTRSSLASAELFTPATETWLAVVSMRCPRSTQAQVTLADAQVLVVGGDAAFPGSPPAPKSCAELFSLG